MWWGGGEEQKDGLQARRRNALGSIEIEVLDSVVCALCRDLFIAIGLKGGTHFTVLQ